MYPHIRACSACRVRVRRAAPAPRRAPARAPCPRHPSNKSQASTSSPILRWSHQLQLSLSSPHSTGQHDSFKSATTHTGTHTAPHHPPFTFALVTQSAACCAVEYGHEGCRRPLDTTMLPEPAHRASFVAAQPCPPLQPNVASSNVATGPYLWQLPSESWDDAAGTSTHVSRIYASPRALDPCHPRFDCSRRVLCPPGFRPRPEHEGLGEF